MTDETAPNIETAQTEISTEPIPVPEKPTETLTTQTAQTDNSGSTQPPVELPEPVTAQIPGNEPLVSEPSPEIERVESITQPTPALPPLVSITPNKQELMVKARASIQNRKRKKLDRILEVFNTKEKITNDEVEKLLHVSDATATRYLEQLEKEGKIKQEGRTGKEVSYSRM